MNLNSISPQSAKVINCALKARRHQLIKDIKFWCDAGRIARNPQRVLACYRLELMARSDFAQLDRVMVDDFNYVSWFLTQIREDGRL